MNKFYLIILLVIICFSFTFAQGTIRGKITDENGESLIGVTVFLKNDKTVGTFSDLDGNYSLNITSSIPQILIVSYVSYNTIEEKVNPINNEVLIKNFNLSSESNSLIEVEVIAQSVKSKEYFMENIKKNSATTLDYISSETMKKTGDPNVTAAVARVSGVSTSGGLITVRGIGDRYIKTTLNGLRIPTLDPLTNNIKLDIFPSSLVDNIILTKTASADLSGDWSGAFISVETKDYPEKLAVNFETQIGYNEQSSFKDVISSQRSSTDWLGYDNNLRDRKHDKLVTANLTPTTYQEMIALGLGNYFNSLGVTSWIDGSSEGNTYFKLGLVQLGLLAPALINDPAAYIVAKNSYNNQYKAQAFDKINPEGTDLNNGFSNNWNTRKRKAPLNFSQSFSVGNQTKLFGKTLGYVFGIRYGNATRYDPNGISQRVRPGDVGAFDLKTNDEISRETNGWSALFNISYKLNSKNSISFLFMPNVMGTNDVRNSIDTRDGYNISVSKNQFYEQRKQLVYQFKSEHYAEKIKTKIDFNASYTKGNSSAPDFKVIEYLRDDSAQVYQFSPTAGDGIRRFYRYLSDNIFDSRLSAELPIGKSTSGVRKLKFGGAYQQNNRRSDLYDYYLTDGNNNIRTPLTSDDLDGYLSPDKFVITNGLVDYKYALSNPDRNHTIGLSKIKAGFVMLDYTIIPMLRISGGLRVEEGTIFSDVVQYHVLGYKAEDERRENVGGFPYIKPANLNELSYLPSANIILKFKENKYAQINMRVNYSQTVARPNIRELNDGAVYDNEFRTLIYGNSDLKMAHIKNYDLRIESYFKNGDNVSVSLFYKDFKNHIEMGFGSSGVTWENIDKSTVKGLEFEGKKSVTNYFELKANVTLVNSNSQFIRKNLTIVGTNKIYTPLDTINRPMFGQAPYIINGILVYKADSLGLVATLSYNVQGPRLVIAGELKERPDVYELPRHTLDFKISKNLGKHFNVNFTVRDVLNAPIRRAYKMENEWVDYDNYKYGTNYILGLLYKL